MKNNKVVLYYGLMIVLLVLIGLSTFFFNYFYNMRNDDLSLEKIKIEEENRMGYNIKLFDNDYFKTNEDDTSYLFDKIDYVDANFNISTIFEEPVEGDYNYIIHGYLVTDDDKSEFYTGEFNRYKINGSVINLTNSFNIDVDTIEKNYHDVIVPDKTSILYEVTFSYAVFSNKLSKSLTNEKVLTINIPVKQISDITLTEDKDEVTENYSELKHANDSVYVVICLEFLGAIIIFILLIVLIVKRINGQDNLYQELLNRILDTYHDYIIYLKNLPNLDDYDVLFVRDMRDLLEMARKTKNPISFIEVIEKSEASFIVFDKSKAYVYKLSKKNV